MPQNREQTENDFRRLIATLGEDPEREGLVKTPGRMFEALTFLTSGYRTDLDKEMNDAVFSVSYQDMVIVRDIEVYSLCEHHMLPFYGRCHVGYIPNGKVLGLSKIPRIVDVFARRLQVQERLTQDIAEALQTYLNPRGVGVICEAYHMCMMMRGVQKQSSYTVTSTMLGDFKNPGVRSEFFDMTRSQPKVF